MSSIPASLSGKTRRVLGFRVPVAILNYNPSPGVLVESVKDAWLKSLEDHAIGTLDLTVSTWMSDRGPVDPDVVSIIEVQELLPGEVCSMVGVRKMDP